MYKFSNSFKEFVESDASLNSNELIQELSRLLISTELQPTRFEEVLNDFKLSKVEDIKTECIDFLIRYADFILVDNYISESEMNDFQFLKLWFKIKEGDFIRLQKIKIKEILKKQFLRIYSDNSVSTDEAIQKVNLQALFDLSYDEFENLKKDEILEALSNGAKVYDLDISQFPKGFKL